MPAPSSHSSSPPTSPSQPDSLTQKLTEWKKSFKGQWSFVPAELAAERERLASALEEWKSKLRLTWVLWLRKFDGGMASLVVLQRQQQQRGLGMRVGRELGMGM